MRSWVRKLDKEFPYWFFFLSKEMPGLRFTTAAICVFHKIADGKYEFDKYSLANFLETHYAAMNEICLSLDFSIDEIKQLSENVIVYYYGEKPPPSIYSTSDE